MRQGFSRHWTLAIALVMCTHLVVLGQQISLSDLKGATIEKKLEKEVRLGVVRPGVKLEVLCEFKNEFDEELEIVASSSSCGCTKATFEKRRVSPQSALGYFVTLEPGQRIGSFRSLLDVYLKGKTTGKYFVVSTIYGIEVRENYDWFPKLKRIEVDPVTKKSRTVRCVNYSEVDWDCPKILLSNGFEPADVSLEVEEVEGVSRQVLRFAVKSNDLKEDEYSACEIRVFSRIVDAHEEFVLTSRTAFDFSLRRAVEVIPGGVMIDSSANAFEFQIISKASDFSPASVERVVAAKEGLKLPVAFSDSSISDRWLRLLLKVDANTLANGGFEAMEVLVVGKDNRKLEYKIPILSLGK